MLIDLRSSDPAGNALTSVFATIAMAVQWQLIAALVLVAGPKAQRLPALFAVALAGAASWVGMGLLNDSFYRDKWPIIQPALAPLVIVALLYRGRLIVSVPLALALFATGLGAALYRANHRDRDLAARAACPPATNPAPRPPPAPSASPA
ncbi:MAG TPA: hypothetical protein VGK29_18995 [Paludibaculum sp.]|jgi:hypothetical protein